MRLTTQGMLAGAAAGGGLALALELLRRLGIHPPATFLILVMLAALLATRGNGAGLGAALATVLFMVYAVFMGFAPAGISLNPVYTVLSIAILLAVILQIERQARKNTELKENVIRQKALFERLFSNAPLPIVIVDAKGNIHMANQASAEGFGYRPKALIGEPIEVLLPDDETLRKAHRKYREDFMKAPQARPMGKAKQLLARRQSGERFPVEVGLVPLEIEGEPFVAAFVKDLSEIDQVRRDLEATLAQAKAFGIRMRTSPSPGWELIGPVESVTGYPAAYFQNDLGKFLAMVDPSIRDEIERHFTEIIENDGDLNQFFRFQHADGDWRWLRTIAHCEKGELVVFVQDVTELVEEQTKALAAKRASEEKNRFLSRMSHELRTPLNAILGFAQLMEMDGKLSESQLEAVSHILKAGKHLLTLIDEVLEIAKAESGHVHLSLEPVQMAEVLNETVGLVKPIAQQENITLHPPAAEARRHYAFADRQRLVQVLLNLLVNAVRYNHPGGAVWVRTREDDDEIAIEVEDTGIGIPASMRARAFEPFDRLDLPTSEPGGSGLGLAISKRFTELMGGSLSFSSKEGRGSTFVVRLPKAQPPPEPADEPGDPNPGQAGAKTVLYIEDNPANLKLMQRILAQLTSIRLIATTQGRMGITLAREHNPDLVLLDLELPDMSGLEVLAQLKGHPKTQAIPVVILSASTVPERSGRALASGAYAFLTKPLDVRRFIELTSQILSDRT